MSTSDDRIEDAEHKTAQKQMMVEAAKEFKSQGKNNAEIAEIMDISENRVRTLLEDINWRQNCLTSGPHDGRPDAIWNIPLNYAIIIFSKQQLALLVLTRIHKDALQITHHNEQYTTEWASRVREIAEERYDRTLQVKVGEIAKYYKTTGWENDQESAIERVAEGKLNPRYQPLHPHDTINMLCRIIGVGASMKASEELIK